MHSKHLLIAEDHPLVVKGLKQLIRDIDSSIEIHVTDSCEGFISEVKSKSIRYCIVDLNLVDGISFDSIDNYLKLFPEANVMVFTAFPGALYAKRLFKIGIHGFVNKNADEEELTEAIKNLISDKFYISPEFLPLIFNSAKSNKSINPFNLLSTKEMIVIEYLRDGSSIKSISEKMGNMPNTVATYKKRAFQKLDIQHILQLDSLYKSYEGPSFEKPESILDKSILSE
ncbi:MAG: response regulator transcription factor [Chitinophagaceae bacterium]|nr:response regulator transcription factor [Chitinophagaceae bacterium]